MKIFLIILLFVYVIYVTSEMRDKATEVISGALGTSHKTNLAYFLGTTIISVAYIAATVYLIIKVG